MRNVLPANEQTTQREEIRGNSSKAHTVYPIFKVHSTGFISNVTDGYIYREHRERTLKIGEEIPCQRNNN